MAQKSDASGTWKTSVTFDPASVNTVALSAQDVTVPGVLGDCDEVLNVIPPAALNYGLLVRDARVKSGVDNTVTVDIMNITGGSLDAASGTWIFEFARHGK